MTGEEIATYIIVMQVLGLLTTIADKLARMEAHLRNINRIR